MKKTLLVVKTYGEVPKIRHLRGQVMKMFSDVYIRPPYSSVNVPNLLLTAKIRNLEKKNKNHDFFQKRTKQNEGI